MTTKSTRNKFSMLHRVCNLLPGHLAAKVARKHGVVARARTFSPWSHVVVMMHAHLAHAIGPNDVCEATRAHRAKLGTIRGAAPPSRNALSHGNKARSAAVGGANSGD